MLQNKEQHTSFPISLELVYSVFYHNQTDKNDYKYGVERENALILDNQPASFSSYIGDFRISLSVNEDRTNHKWSYTDTITIFLSAHSTNSPLSATIEPKEASLLLKREKRFLVLDSYEWRLAIEGMNNFRSHLIQAGMPTEDVNTLLIKLIKAKAKRRLRR